MNYYNAQSSNNLKVNTLKPEEFDELQKKMIEEDLKFLQTIAKEGAKISGKEDIVNLAGESTWHCKKCGSEIMGFKIAFSIHDGFSLFGGSHTGGGRCHYIVRPYCPECNPSTGGGFPEVPSLGYKFSSGCIDY